MDPRFRGDDTAVSAKMSAARKAAFFDALRATGNQTLAAEAAKVSRSWVSLHRAQDPAFRRAMDDATAEARERLGAHPERRPPSGWGFLDGEELVVKGTGGSGAKGRRRRVQIARARLKQITPRVEDRFLAVLSATGNVKAACAEAGVSVVAIYAHRQRWPGFARRWDEAVDLAGIRLEFALVHFAANPFAAPELPEPAELSIVRSRPAGTGPEDGEGGFALTFDEGMHSLYMTQHRRYGLGGRPGRSEGGPHEQRLAAAFAAVSASIDAIERADALSEADKALDRAEYARRREAARGG